MLTAELRWFFEGSPAPELLAAFAMRGAEEEQRTDRYLRFASAASVGIKLREGRLEAKARIQAAQVSWLPDLSVSGVEEWWEKQAISAEMQSGDLDEEWLSVQKHRLLIPAGTGRFSELGVSAEVTRLVIENQAFWTLGFEAEGPPPAASDRLLRAAREFLPDLFRRADLDALCAERSMSYPEWLLGLHRV